MKLLPVPAPAQIKATRKDAGLTQAEAAKLVYCSREAWSKWEVGSNQMPRAYWELFKIKLEKA